MNNLFEQAVQPQDKSIRHIPLSQGQVAIVSAESYDWLMQWKWYAAWDPKVKMFYARRHDAANNFRILGMHQALRPNDKRVDHKNGNGLDNRLKNLRPCTHAQNAWNGKLYSRNTSGHKGVRQRKDNGMWTAQVYYNGKCHWVGQFTSKRLAIKARRTKAIELHGEFYRER